MGAIRYRSLILAGSSALLVATSCAEARRPGAVSFNLPSQSLGASLRTVAALAHVNVAAPSDLVDNRQAPALSGDYTAAEAVARLLQGSGLHAEQAGAAIIVRADASGLADGTAQAMGAQDEVLVTGSRIRGAPIASSMIRTSQDDIRNLGRTDLGQVIREIPQNFGGGQNPGIGQTVPQASGADVGGGSALNLRGLGSDATLTLLNGHRLAYTAVFQSVDISFIPIDILDRIEIVPDGASAIYGSDAVAGVANVVLKRDFDGVQLSSSLGKATDGGDFDQRYGAMAGRRWASGGLVAAIEYGRSTAIRSDQRAYAAQRSPGLTLFPPLRHESAVVTGHQEIGEHLSVSFDALYNGRKSSADYPFVPADDPSNDRGTWRSNDHSAAVAPTIEWTAGSWRTRLVSSYGWEKVDYSQTECVSGSCGPDGSGFYRNREYSTELGSDGNLFSWSGGTAKMALGAGYRNIEFERYAGLDAVNLNTRHSQDSYFAYAEFSLPLVSPDNKLSFLRSASASAALRYERYPGIGDIVRPKLGLIVAPTSDFDLKLSWGKSFRAPTLYEQYQPQSVYLFPPSFVGGTGFPAGATTLIVLGGNRNLKPERASTLSATFDFHPQGSRFDLAATFFSVAYRNRIVMPIRFLSNGLSDPSYAGQVVRNPTAAQVAATVANAATFLNATGAPLDPAAVVAIVSDNSVNAGRVNARGLDLLATYILPAGRSEFRFTADLSYLGSTQQLTATSPLETLAGTIFSPPHWRSQGTASWHAGDVTLTSELNYIGGVRDTRAMPTIAIRGMTTAGLTARWQVRSRSASFNGLDLSVSAQNLFNAKPQPIATTLPEDTPYDSTNYSPIGRFLSIAVRKAW